MSIAIYCVLSQNKLAYFQAVTPPKIWLNGYFSLILDRENKMAMDDNNQIIIYQSEDGETRVEVKFTGETVWLS